MDDLNILHEIATDPASYAEHWKKESGGKIIGYFCSYTPEEFISAADALPVRILGDKVSIALANAHLQSYCCSLARGGLEQVLAGKLSYLDGAVFSHTCDTMQRLSDIWRLNAGLPLHFDVVLPIKLNSQSAFHYLVHIFYQFTRELAQSLDLEITDNKLAHVIDLYNQIRRGLEQLYVLRAQNPDLISGSQLWGVTKAAMVMDREDFLGHLIRIITKLQSEKVVPKRYQKRLILAGSICTYPEIYSLLEHLGAVVIWDDLCTGARYFSGEIQKNSDPIEAIARRYFDRVICPTKHINTKFRAQHLVRIAKEHQADGIIFLLLKFCDPHAFDYPFLKQSLDNEQIPNMLLEIEAQLPAEGQLRTRLEAFVEML